MSYTQIKARIIDQSVQMINEAPIASGGENVIQIVCTFCPLWEGMTKTAVFHRGDSQVFHILMEGDSVIVPKEVIADKGSFFFGIIGINGDQVRPTVEQQLTVERGAITSATAVPDPTPDIYTQIIQLIQQSSVLPDVTLTKSGKAADAMATGLAIQQAIDGATAMMNGAINALKAYGIGCSSLISAEQIDATTAPGWYRISGEMTINNVTESSWYMFVAGYGDGSENCVQKLYPVTAYRLELVRFMNASVWAEWECTNPPMMVGVEYRTTERWCGKSVYTKLINFGNLPNATQKWVDHGITFTNMLRAEGEAGGTCFPRIGTSSFAYIALYVNTTAVGIHCESNMSGQMASVQLWYTKD